MTSRFALALLLTCLSAGDAKAGDAQRFGALEGLKPEMPFADIRRRILRAGWHPYRGNGTRNLARCEDRPEVCRTYPEAQGCWRDADETFCGFEYLDTRRRPARLSDEILRMRVRVGPGGRLFYHDQNTTSFAGPG